jgi:hypothetical protein
MRPLHSLVAATFAGLRLGGDSSLFDLFSGFTALGSEATVHSARQGDVIFENA